MITSTIFVCLSFFVIGYLFGSVLFGSIAGMLTKHNFRAIGSKNIGGTNVSRALGKPIGFCVSFMDGMKGYLAIIICWVIYRYSVFIWYPTNQSLQCLIYLSGIFAVVGHCFPISFLFLLFKSKFNFAIASSKIGGKGVSTTGGVIFAISPWLGLISFGIWLTTLLIFKYVSFSSMLAMFGISFFVFITKLDFVYLLHHSLLYNQSFNITMQIKSILMLIMLCNSFIVIVRHRQNINRLIHKQEKKFF